MMHSQPSWGLVYQSFSKYDTTLFLSCRNNNDVVRDKRFYGVNGFLNKKRLLWVLNASSWLGQRRYVFKLSFGPVLENMISQERLEVISSTVAQTSTCSNRRTYWILWVKVQPLLHKNLSGHCSLSVICNLADAGAWLQAGDSSVGLHWRVGINNLPVSGEWSNESPEGR